MKILKSEHHNPKFKILEIENPRTKFKIQKQKLKK